MPERVQVKAIYDPKTKMIKLDIGPAHLSIEPEHFSRMMEYLGTFWSAFCEWKKKQHGGMDD